MHEVILAIAAPMVLATLSAPAAAAEWSGRGGWRVAAADAGCVLRNAPKMRTSFMIRLERDGAVAAQVRHPTLIDEIAVPYVRYVVNGRSYDGVAPGTDRRAAVFHEGFRIDPAFLEDFGRGRTLVIYNDKGGRVDSLSLNGSLAAVRELRRCTASMAPPRLVSVKPRSRAPLRELVSNEDYPVSALRAGEEGTVRFTLRVGPSGRVHSCTITQSSGSAALDSTTCRLMRSRARFSPARNSAGEPIEMTVSDELAWTLPRS